MKIGIASDHCGYYKKEKLKRTLIKRGLKIIDYGAESFNKEDDYPRYAFKLCENINDIDFGILICGSGIGMSISANKVKGIRCAKVSNLREAKYTRLDNDANVIALSSKMTVCKMKALVKRFAETNFSEEERHLRRIKMIDEYGNNI